jgi:hypothetical protein
LSGVQFKGSSKHHDFAGIGIGGGDYQRKAAKNAIRDALKSFFDAYAPPS